MTLVICFVLLVDGLFAIVLLVFLFLLICLDCFLVFPCFLWISCTLIIELIVLIVWCLADFWFCCVLICGLLWTWIVDLSCMFGVGLVFNNWDFVVWFAWSRLLKCLVVSYVLLFWILFDFLLVLLIELFKLKFNFCCVFVFVVGIVSKFCASLGGCCLCGSFI